MIRYIRELRLIPIALIASACLLVLKTADIALHGSSLLFGDDMPARDRDVSVIRPMPEATQPPGSLLSWAQQMFNFPDGSGSSPLPSHDNLPRIAERDNFDITGSIDADHSGTSAASGPDAKVAPAGLPSKDTKPKLPPSGVLVSSAEPQLPTGAERAILEHLQERRQELDARARELDIRESLIQGAEKRMDAKLDEIKQTEARIKVETQQKDEAEAARLKGLVAMYENMKPRDAAKIFDRLDLPVLVEVSTLINPRQMADILAQMSPDVAEHLTVELASKAQQTKADGTGDLPKIQGQPIAQ